MLTSPRKKPKPNTFVRIEKSGEPEYVWVGNYRLKSIPTGGCHLYIANSFGDGWEDPLFFNTQKEAKESVQVATGALPAATVYSRLHDLEKRVKEHEQAAGPEKE